MVTHSLVLLVYGSTQNVKIIDEIINSQQVFQKTLDKIKLDKKKDKKKTRVGLQ